MKVLLSKLSMGQLYTDDIDDNDDDNDKDNDAVNGHDNDT